MKLATRLTLGFGSLTLVAVGLGIASYYGSARNAVAIGDLAQTQMPALQALKKTESALNIIKASQRTMLNLGIDSAVRKRQDELLGKSKSLSDEAFKSYRALPKGKEEEALWQQFQAEWAVWSKDNDEFLRLFHQVETLQVGNPLQLECDLARFRGDHFKLEKQVLGLCQSGEAFAGGEDHSACGFGRWQAAQKIGNPEIVKVLQEIGPTHKKFHDSVRQAKALVAASNIDGAKKVFREETEPACESTLSRFDAMLKVAGAASELGDAMKRQALEVCRVSQLKVEGLILQLEKLKNQEAETHAQSAESLSGLLKTVSLVLVLAGLAMGLALTVLLTRSITRPIQAMAEVITASSDQTAAASGQVASASQVLAEVASEQAASLEETSSALEEMTSMTNRNSESAQTVNDLARQTRVAAESSVNDMQAMASAMDAIKQSSDNIANIIKTINEIAFQTNILALNAAVEAARAGEAGMGFAVVADEVRNLAQRAAQAVQETSGKIEAAIANTAHGVRLSSQVAHSLQGIVEKVRQVDDLAAAVAAASREQSQGLGQVNTALTQMDKATQSNAASAEESASAAEELNAQASTLREAANDLSALIFGEKGSSPSVESSSAFSGSRRPPAKSSSSKGRSVPKSQPSLSMAARAAGSSPTVEPYPIAMAVAEP
jgi:methyl-accepting chemotaxis protein